MNSKTKTIIGIFIFIAFLGIAYKTYTSLSKSYQPQSETQSTQDDSADVEASDPTQASPDAEANDNAAPDFTVYDSKGKEVHLSDFIGKPVVVNFWASWCPPCKSEMPYFNSAYEREKDNVVFMMVDLSDGQRETQKDGQSYVDKQGFSFPVYFDNDQDAASTYEISSIPLTLFIDSKGSIVNANPGALNEKKLSSLIEQIKK